VRPSPRGLAAAAAGAALIAAGFAFGYPELAVLGATAVLAAGYAVGYVAWRPGLTVRRTVVPDRVSRGEPCTHTLAVRQAGRLRPATLLAEDRCAGSPVPVALVGLRAGQDTTVDYPVPTGRRGVVEIGPLTVGRSDPLGLVGVRRRFGGTARVWVHPRTHPLTAVPAGIARSLDGRVDRVPNGSITFDTLRQYVLGDELRRVHWRTTARIGELMVREYVDTSLPRLVVLLDDRAGGYPEPERFEDACEAAASVLVAAVRAELSAHLLLVSGAPAGPPQEAPVNSGLAGPAPSPPVQGGLAGPAPGAPAPGRVARTSPADPTPLLDRLAEATLTPTGRDGDGGSGSGGSGSGGSEGALHRAVARLRQYQLGDTLVYLTGSGRPEELAPVGALRGRYPTVVVAVLGDRATAQASTVEGVHLLAADDAAGFAAAWDGIGQW
jgi:Protein of unknown function DUF58